MSGQPKLNQFQSNFIIRTTSGLYPFLRIVVKVKAKSEIVSHNRRKLTKKFLFGQHSDRKNFFFLCGEFINDFFDHHFFQIYIEAETADKCKKLQLLLILPFRHIRK